MKHIIILILLSVSLKVMSQTEVQQASAFENYRCKHDNWQKVIYKSNVTGYHYWLNDADSDYLSKRFSISGIPFFILVSKNGEIITNEVPWPSSDKIKDTLNKLLEMSNVVN
ncbi:MAG TPA: hypothetical protein VK172_07065 [Lentimicrobium sp.]|nr:hypothetical protein [Lentimicrobium sp.]